MLLLSFISFLFLCSSTNPISPPKRWVWCAAWPICSSPNPLPARTTSSARLRCTSGCRYFLGRGGLFHQQHCQEIDKKHCLEYLFRSFLFLFSLFLFSQFSFVRFVDLIFADFLFYFISSANTSIREPGRPSKICCYAALRASCIGPFGNF